MAELGTTRLLARAADDDTTERTRARPWSAGLAATALTLVPLAWEVARRLSGMPWSKSGASDYAGFENDLRAALHGDLLLGTSSRVGVRNLGPFHGYWMAPWYALTGEGMGGMILATWILHALALAAVVLVVRSAGGDRAAWAVAVALCLALVRAGPVALSDPFNPAYTLAAVLLSTVAAAAVARGAWRFLPLLALAASAGAQVHLVSAPSLGLLAVVALGLGLRRARPTRRHVLAAAAVLLLLWTPTLVDQVAGSGNLSAVAGALWRGPETSEQPFGQPATWSRRERAQLAVQLTALTTGHATDQATMVGVFLGPPPTTAIRTALGVAALAGAALAAWFGRRRAPLGSLVVAFAFGGAIITYLPIAVPERGINAYYLAPLIGYGLALAAGLGIVGGALLPPSRRLSRTVLVAVLCATVVGQVDDGHDVSPLSVWAPTEEIAFADHVVATVPAPCLERGVALEARVIQMADLWTIMVALDKRGFPTTVPPELEAFAGPGHRRTGDEPVVVHVPTANQFRTGDIPPDAVDARGCR